MRIVELVDSLRIGGAERVVCNLSSALAERGHQVSVVCLRTAGPLVECLKAAGIEVHALNKPEGMHLPTFRRLTKYLRDCDAHVVHTHNPLVHHYGVGAGRLARTPVIVNTTHGIGNLSDRFGKRELLFRWMCEATDRVVAVCPAAGERFRASGIVPSRKLTVIDNGIPLAAFLAARRRDTRNPFVFGTLGRLVPVKNHYGLLDAFSKIRREIPGVQLEIAGDGPLREELETHARELGISSSVTFLGPRSDIPAVMQGWSAFVLSSLSEGLPMALLEAMACGLPIVTTNVGGAAEIVQSARCGWWCAPGDTGGLAQGMCSATACADLEEKGERARSWATRLYSVERMAEQYEQLFEEICRDKLNPGSKACGSCTT